MTRQDLTHIYFLLDRSGSMQSIKTDIEGGFAAFIDDQKNTPGACRATLVQFDDRYDIVYAGVPITEVPSLQLQPRGSTALLDAMGKLITEAGDELAALPEDARPGIVIVAVMTDGRDNVSHEWTREAIKKLVEQQTKQYQWQFMYMGADQDAVEVGAGLGVDPGYSMTYERGKAGDALRTTSDLISSYRSARAANPQAAMPRLTSEERSKLA